MNKFWAKMRFQDGAVDLLSLVQGISCRSGVHHTPRLWDLFYSVDNWVSQILFCDPEHYGHEHTPVDLPAVVTPSPDGHGVAADGLQVRFMLQYEIIYDA